MLAVGSHKGVTAAILEDGLSWGCLGFYRLKVFSKDKVSGRITVGEVPCSQCLVYNAGR